jgi:hypothetical protein
MITAATLISSNKIFIQKGPRELWLEEYKEAAV